MIDRPYRDDEPVEEYGPIRASEQTWRQRIYGALFGVAAAVLFGFFGALSRGESPRDAGRDAVEAAREQLERELGKIVREEMSAQGLAYRTGEPESAAIAEQADRIAQLEADLRAARIAAEEAEIDRRQAWANRDRAIDEAVNEVSNELAAAQARIAQMEAQNAELACFPRDQLNVELRRLCTVQ